MTRAHTPHLQALGQEEELTQKTNTQGLDDSLRALQSEPRPQAARDTKEAAKPLQSEGTQAAGQGEGLSSGAATSTRAPLPRPKSVPARSPAQPSLRDVAEVRHQNSTRGGLVTRSRSYSFVLDPAGQAVELGSGRFAKTFLGEETWIESKTVFRREVAIKVLQKGVSEEDALRFQMEKEILERVQGHPNIIQLYASGEGDTNFIPDSIREKVEEDYLILELCDFSLEERLKGARNRSERENLLAYSMDERILRTLEFILPVCAAVEYAHLVRNVCHRDIKPANILIRNPDSRLKGSMMEMRLADFNIAKVFESDVNIGLTRVKDVPGTLYFQSPEQETNTFEVLCNVTQGSNEVEFFEDFFIQMAQNDSFQVFNRQERYTITSVDRSRKRLYLDRPFREASESNVRGKINKSVDRPADIYSLGAMLYYLISGACANPKSLYDAFHKFIEYEADDPMNAVEAYIDHEYEVIRQLWAPKSDEQGMELAPADRFFSYKHYLDGNGELIDRDVMKIIARAMIRNKPDSYCQAWETQTAGISDLVQDMRDLYGQFGDFIPAKPGYLPSTRLWIASSVGLLSWWRRLLDWLRLGNWGGGARNRRRTATKG